MLIFRVKKIAENARGTTFTFNKGRERAEGKKNKRGKGVGKPRFFILGLIGRTKGAGAAPRPRPLRSSGGEEAELRDARFSRSPTASKAGQRGCSSHGASVLLSPPRPLFRKRLVCALAASIRGRVPPLPTRGDSASFMTLKPFVERDSINPLPIVQIPGVFLVGKKSHVTRR